MFELTISAANGNCPNCLHCDLDEDGDDNNEEILQLLSRAGVYYIFAFDDERNLYEHSGGKFMSFHRFFDYAYIKPFQVNRLLGDDGSPPARIVFCCMAQLPFSGRLDLDKDEVPNTRNRIVEVVESAYLKALRHTIPGRQLYGDGRTMSAREFMKFAKENGEGQGLGYFDNGIGRKNSKSKKNSTPGGGVALGAPGKARATKTTGANVHLRDPLDPTRLALFEFYYVRGRGDEQEIIKGEGPLCWGGGYSPYLRTTLNGQDAIKINGEKRKQNQVHPNVATDLPIKYVPSDGSDPVELGNVVGGEFEKFHPKQAYHLGPYVWHPSEYRQNGHDGCTEGGLEG